MIWESHSDAAGQVEDPVEGDYLDENPAAGLDVHQPTSQYAHVEQHLPQHHIPVVQWPIADSETAFSATPFRSGFVRGQRLRR